MKFPFICSNCAAVNPIEYADQDIYRFECVACDCSNACALRQERFEILFDFGALAYDNGYHREAVADFVTALERFFEFFIRTVLRERGLSDDVVGKTWKLMSKQSERQLGAFATAYLYSTGEYPTFLQDNKLKTAFRNSVIHKGKIPSQQETSEYAETVYTLIRDLIHELWQIAPNAVGRIRHDHVDELLRQAENDGYAAQIFAYDGMFGISRFHPMSVASTQRRREIDAESGAIPSPECLRTDMSFEDTLEARRMFVKASFYDEHMRTPEGRSS